MCVVQYSALQGLSSIIACLATSLSPLSIRENPCVKYILALFAIHRHKCAENICARTVKTRGGCAAGSERMMLFDSGKDIAFLKERTEEREKRKLQTEKRGEAEKFVLQRLSEWRARKKKRYCISHRRYLQLETRLISRFLFFKNDGVRTDKGGNADFPPYFSPNTSVLSFVFEAEEWSDIKRTLGSFRVSYTVLLR